MPMERAKRWLAVVPSSATLLGVGFGMLALVWTEHDPYAAALAIMMACLCDMVDGRLARWTGAQSEFGAQLDSLADIVSFGVAPAYLVYRWSLEGRGPGAVDLGFGLAFFYVAAAAVRLARFTARGSANSPSTDFAGLPTPAAALLLSTSVMAAEETGLALLRGPWWTVGIVLVASLLMVSPLPFRSFKSIGTKWGRWLFFGSILAGLSLLVGGGPGGAVLLSLLLLYVVSAATRALVE